MADVEMEAQGVAAYLQIALTVIGLLAPIIAGLGWRWANRAVHMAAAGARWIKEDRQAYYAGKLLALDIAKGTAMDAAARAAEVVQEYDEADAARTRILQREDATP